MVKGVYYNKVHPWHTMNPGIGNDRPVGYFIARERKGTFVRPAVLACTHLVVKAPQRSGCLSSPLSLSSNTP